MRHTSSPLGTLVSSDKKIRRKRPTQQQVTLRDLSVDHIKQIYEKQKSDSIDGVTGAITDCKTVYDHSSQSFITAPGPSAEKGEVIARRHSGFNWLDLDRRTESPVPICTRSCNGWCRNEINVSNHDHKQAHVVSDLIGDCIQCLCERDMLFHSRFQFLPPVMAKLHGNPKAIRWLWWVFLTFTVTTAYRHTTQSLIKILGERLDTRCIRLVIHVAQRTLHPLA